MATERFEIMDDLEVRPTAESRERLAALGITDERVQDDCYAVLAEGLGAVERARRAEQLATAALRADYLASQ